jgi:oligoribonuclease
MPLVNNNNGHLIWIDLEMTGLNPETDRILEIATIVTDSELNIVEQGPVYAIHQNDTVLNGMDNWNKEHHSSTGLIKRVKSSSLDEKEAEEKTISFIKKYVKKGSSPLCGNTIYQDRAFLKKYMQELESYFHYRIIDVSSIKELILRWYPDLPVFKKENTHEALKDILESIEELKYYKTNIFKEK